MIINLESIGSQAVNEETKSLLKKTKERLPVGTKVGMKENGNKTFIIIEQPRIGDDGTIEVNIRGITDNECQWVDQSLLEEVVLDPEGVRDD